ncbi:MAG: ComF family protein [Myxococcota bacterium]
MFAWLRAGFAGLLVRSPLGFASLRAGFAGLLDLVVPPRCAACGACPGSASALCPSCDRRLQRIPRTRCALCQAAPVPEPGGFCSACNGASRPFVACIAAVAFAGDLEDWIHRFKYPAPGIAGLDPAAWAVVRQLIRESADRVPGPPPALIVPIPLHPRRLRTRGFNPSARLARVLARDRRVRVDPVALERIRDTPSQTGLSRKERRRNVRGAFRARGHVPRDVWLVDDVVTTASTLAEAARALRRSGAQRIVCVCVARTVLGGDPAICVSGPSRR